MTHLRPKKEEYWLMFGLEEALELQKEPEIIREGPYIGRQIVNPSPEAVDRVRQRLAKKGLVPRPHP